MRSKGRITKAAAGIFLFCALALGSRGREEDPEYGYLPAFVSVPAGDSGKVSYLQYAAMSASDTGVSSAVL